MLLTKSYLAECEELIAQSKTAEVLNRLIAVKDATGYKNEILSLSSRWKRLDRDTMTGTKSDEERSLAYSRISKNLLTLLAAMSRELDGEKVEKNLFGTSAQPPHTYRPMWQTYVPILLTAIGVWCISYFAYQPAPIDCHQAYNLAGNWDIYTRDSTGAEIKIGDGKIAQDSCSNGFQFSGEVSSLKSPNNPIDFSSRIAGLNDGEILFVYENFDGEMGVCRGVVPGAEDKSIMFSCVDLIGRDRNDSPELRLWLKPGK